MVKRIVDQQQQQHSTEMRLIIVRIIAFNSREAENTN